MAEPLFHDRRHAGRLLAEKLGPLEGDAVVLAMVRGGVPVAAEIARALDAPLRAWPVCKIGAPTQPEYALGAVGPGGVAVWNESAVDRMGVSEPDRRRMEEQAREEVDRRAARYGQADRTQIEGRTAVLVDDGIATGLTMRAAIEAVRACRPRGLIVVAPVCPGDAAARLGLSDRESLLFARELEFPSVGACYRDFHQVGDREVEEILRTPRSG